jgi:hydroxymethylglutaryl-CoA synthase
VFSTQLPIGSGLGASAAFLLALLKSLRPQLSDRDLYTAAVEIEHLQHGTSSGIDVWTSLHGGLWWLHREERLHLDLATLPGFRLLHSGAPASTTGECVQQVRRDFPADHPVWEDFTRVTHQTREAVEHHRSDHWSEAIRQNHRLLTRIGVVPEAVQEAVRNIEQQGGSAKICGAGSVRGDSAGILLVRDADPESIPQHWSDIQAGFCQTGTSA